MIKDLHSVYRQLHDLLGTATPMRDLVRDIAGRSDAAKAEINYGGNKDDLIRALRIAVDRRYATIEEVHRLLWDVEEVGKQHILLLRPAPVELAPTDAHVVDGPAVAEALFDDTPLDHLFPRFEHPSNGYIWSDFRLSEDGGWLGKAYGLETYRQSQGLVSTEELEGGTIQEVRQYTWKDVNTTLVAKWRPNSQILELRIDISNLQNEKTVQERRNHLWKLLSPAFKRSDLIGVDIDPLLNSIIFEREKPENRERYSISRVELTDPRSGLIRVIPKGAEELDHDPGRKASLKAMQTNSFKPSLVRVEWKGGLEGCPDCMTEPVSVVIEKTGNGPELRILKRITNATYEYISDQLRSRLRQFGT